MAGIVLYNPSIPRLKEEILSINLQVDKIVLCDNGSINLNNVFELIELLKLKDKVVVMSLNENMGIGYALNKIFEYAESNFYNWVLTLDHDTICPQNIIEEYKKLLSLANVAIIAPQVVDSEIVSNHWYSSSDNDYEQVDQCIQSGALVKVQAWRDVNGFDEWMFIDFVDFDFCKKININKYIILKSNKIKIDHELGKRCETKLKKIGEFLFTKTRIKYFRYLTYKNDFSAARIYYCTRNNLVYIKKYKNYINFYKEMFMFVKRIVIRFVRGNNRMMIIAQTFKGIKDSMDYKEPTYSMKGKK